MPNSLGISGAQPQKPTRFAPIYTGRWSSGIWTNRSPLRDAATTRISEHFYGAAGDALIDGLNVEVTNRLTLARRPGASAYDSNTYSAPDRFYEFRLFNPSSERINVMVDEANNLYSLYGGIKSLVFPKSTGAGQSYMQSVGNTLYWGDGVDNKKWLQTLNTWTASSKWGNSAPFFSTFLVDSNGNIQQLTGTRFAITNVSITADVLTITSTDTINALFAAGDQVTFPATMTATFLENQTVTIDTVATNTFTAAFNNANYTGTESGVYSITVGQGTPISAGTAPTWSTVVPSAGNNFQGGITIDGNVVWTNRGTTVENWGIVAPSDPVTPSQGAAFNANWKANTFYSPAAVIIDSNGNLQQITTSGLAGSGAPTWATVVGHTTTDGTATWTMVQTAAQLVWQPSTAYVAPVVLTGVATSISGSAVYTGVVVGGAANALAGKQFLVTGFPQLANNGIYTCSASTTTSLTLSNPSAVAQSGLEVTQACQWISIQYVIGNAAGTNCLFKLTPSAQPMLSGNVNVYLYSSPTSGPVGCVTNVYPTSTGSALASTTQNSLQFHGTPLGTGADITWDIINGAGAVTGENHPFYPPTAHDYQLIILGNMSIPVAGTYSFSIQHHDGMIWGMGGGATCVGGTYSNPQPQTVTPNMGYSIFGGTNLSGTNTDVFTVTFPTAGIYPFEIDYDYWYHSGQVLQVLCNGQPLANGTIISGSTTPSWPGFSTSYVPNYATVSESAGNLVWSNIGPSTDFAWTASKSYTLPDTIVTDTNGYYESPFRSGLTTATQPTWNTGLNNTTNDNPNLIWLNQGVATSLPSGTVSTFNGGWKYALALVNTLDNTVSNCGPISSATGDFVGLAGISLSPAEGLPPLASIDPQCDYVAIFRTTDGGALPLLIPGVTTTYTVPLSVYIQNGFTDTTPDTGLNNLISGAISGENTPPEPGAINLTYHLNRIFYSVGNVVKWTTGPATPVGNGINGASPLNFDSLPSLVKRIVATSSGILVFTVSDVYIIQGNGTTASPIQSALPLLPGIGLLSYNALDLNGPTIGFFTTDNQFVILDPSSGTSVAGFPIGDRLRLNNGSAGTAWDPSQVYVAWHTQGEDQGWYLCDGQFGWYRLMSTPAPESGFTWSPFASITGGCKAVQSVEVSPGVHKLLIGPSGTGSVLQRDLNVFSDNGTAYDSWAMVGSAVLTQPGQIAEVMFITTDSVRRGSPISLGILVDDAYPYYTGPIDMLVDWVNDPPTLKPSRSFWSQRFYLDQAQEEASVMRHMQIKVQFDKNDTVQNELLSLTIFGSYLQEV